MRDIDSIRISEATEATDDTSSFSLVGSSEHQVPMARKKSQIIGTTKKAIMVHIITELSPSDLIVPWCYRSTDL